MKILNVLQFVFVLALFTGYLKPADAFELPEEERFKEGERSLQDFESRAGHSECWKNAIANLKTGCKKMADIEQSYLAINFTNCHLQKSGKKTYNCSRDKSIELCTRDMSDLAFSTYTEFYTHTTNICFYLQSHAWQERTENTISKLSSTSEQVVDQLENSLDNQILLLKHQQTSLGNQKQIIAREQQLSNTLQSSTHEAREAFVDMKTQASQQKAIFTETFEGIFKSVENIKQLQSMLLGEFITLQSLAFHFVAVCVCYFFTSSPRTTGARLPLFVGLVVLMVMERLVTAWGIGDGSDSNSNEMVHYRLWFCRKMFILASTAGLLITAYKYCDYNRINHDLLRQIQQQIKDLKVLQDKPLKAITSGNTIPLTTASFSHPCMVRDTQHDLSSQSTLSIMATDRVDSGIDATGEDEDVDITYIPNDSDSDSYSDYESLYSESIGNLSRDSFVQTPTQSQRGSSQQGSQRTTSRKSRSKGATPRASVSPSHTYNLRPRRTPQASPFTSSFIDNLPSPATLEELVQGLHHTTARYKAVMHTDKQQASLFSSDEEN